jgi:histone H3/H4
MADALVVGSKVKAVVKGADVNMAGDFIEGLSKEVEVLVKKAVDRCKANGRKTVRACDL